MSCVGKVRSVVVLAVILGLVGASDLRAAEDPAVNRGVQFLRGALAGAQFGESALMTLALIKSGVPLSDPAIVAGLNRIRARFSSSGYQPERQGGTDVYEAAVVS